MLKGKFSINARVRPRPIFEIRYKTTQFNRLIFGLHANLYGVYICIYPFILSLTMSRKIEPSKFHSKDVV